MRDEGLMWAADDRTPADRRSFREELRRELGWIGDADRDGKPIDLCDRHAEHRQRKLFGVADWRVVAACVQCRVATMALWLSNKR